MFKGYLPAGFLTVYDAILRVARHRSPDALGAVEAARDAGEHHVSAEVAAKALLALDYARDEVFEVLTSGALSAAGIRSDTGAIVMVPPAAWRLAYAPGPYALAIQDEPIRLPDGAWARPVLAAADLARWCGAPPEPEPCERPADWPAPPPEAPRAEPPPESALAWMLEHAPGRKRDHAIADCQRDTGATYREALAAWNALPPEARGKRGARKRP